MKKEIRLAELRMAQNSSDEMIVEGNPVVYGVPTVIFESDGIQYKEIIEPGALVGVDMSDVPFRYDHESSVMIMARTRSKTLTITPDANGMSIRAALANTTAGKDLYELIKRGDIDKMSFAFLVAEDSYNRETRTRHIIKFKKIFDVSAVVFPAYDSAGISARDFFSAKTDAEKIAKEEEIRKRLIIATYL